MVNKLLFREKARFGFWANLLVATLIGAALVAAEGQLLFSSQNLTPQAKPGTLTIDKIMRGEELIGISPSGVMWSHDSQRIYFRWRQQGQRAAGFYALRVNETTPKSTSLEEILKTPPVIPAGFRRGFGGSFGSAGFEIAFEATKRRAAVIYQGDLQLLDLKTGKLTQLTATETREANARFSFDGRKILFVAEDNLYAYGLETGLWQQLTCFTRQKPPEQRPLSEIDDWYRRQQQTLFKELGRGQMGGFQSMVGVQFGPRRKPFFLESGQNIVSLELSPDEKKVAFILSEPAPGVKETIVPSYVTRSGYTETITSHSKAAYISPRLSRAGLMNVANGDVTWVELNQGERRVFPVNFLFSPDGKNCLLQARSEDRKDSWLYLLDWNSGKTTVLEQVHDEAWVGPLGLTNVFWSKDGRRIYYISEKDGYAHLYYLTPDGKEKKQLTSGKFEVRSARLSADGNFVYLETNEEHPGETHFYRMAANGGPRTKLTSLVGLNEVYLSPDETMLAIIHSETNKPPELYLQPNKPGEAARQITVSPTEEFTSYPWVTPEVISFKARDGVDIYARVYVPQSWHQSKPAVIFIHGAGYLQNAHKGWSTYFREYMFHNFLREQGYLVFDVDYRGSAGYGRDCRTAIYRHMGGKDLEDIVDAAKFLVSRYGANPKKIGVYGGSYGGFLTLMAMFKEPDVFRAGAALRPVTDWAHYHPGYTVDILNLPHKDPEAYKQSSPIYFPEGLKGALLICHGMVDTNVHFQDTVRLVQRLIELGKENWEVAIYPVEDHSFRNPSSWVDEYKRIFKLFEANLK